MNAIAAAALFEELEERNEPVEELSDSSWDEPESSNNDGLSSGTEDAVNQDLLADDAIDSPSEGKEEFVPVPARGRGRGQGRGRGVAHTGRGRAAQAGRGAGDRGRGGGKARGNTGAAVRGHDRGIAARGGRGRGRGRFAAPYATLSDYGNVDAGGESAVPEFDADGCGMQLPDDFYPQLRIGFLQIIFLRGNCAANGELHKCIC